MIWDSKYIIYGDLYTKISQIIATLIKKMTATLEDV